MNYPDKVTTTLSANCAKEGYQRYFIVNPYSYLCNIKIQGLET
jgi:hypothetical protein